VPPLHEDNATTNLARMKISAKVLVLLAVVKFAAHAQDIPGLGSFNKLFENFPSFSTEMVITIKSASGEIPTVLRSTVTQRNGMRRVESDVARNSGPSFGAETATELKASGMTPMVIISNPTNKTDWLIFPALRGYLQEPDETGREEPITLEKIGESEVGGHPCIKNKLVVKDASLEGSVWNATDLGGFPIKIELKRNYGDTVVTLVVTFEKVSLAVPSESLFRPPSDYQLFADRAALKEAAKRHAASPP
jgi:hypothetical protein